MSRDRTELETRVLAALVALEQDGVIKGLGTENRRVSLAKQIVESYRRVEYVRILQNRGVVHARCDPSNDLFDPLKAAILLQREGQVDESFWMVFVFVHFGKNAKGGWRYAREVYDALGQDRWSWEATSSDPKRFRAWLDRSRKQIERTDVPGGFGNHRKYMSLDANSNAHTGAAFESYVKWIGGTRSHILRFTEITAGCGADSGKRFESLYQSMSAVKGFGRMAKFDYLCMIGKLNLFNVEPKRAYLSSATGPRAGGNLLFAGNANAKWTTARLEEGYAAIERRLNLPFGMQVLEDAVCNWQKSPEIFTPFRG